MTAAIEGLVGSGEVTWSERGFEDEDLDQTWYVMAATDDPEVNARVSELAEQQRIFCVRADDADAATAFTPAVGQPRRRHRRGDGQPRPRTGTRDARAGVRDDIVAALREGSVGSRHHRDPDPGVVLVGGGPGDPELISVAGRKALMEADLVVADRLAPRELLAELPGRHRDRRRGQAAPRALGTSRSRSTGSSSRPRSPVRRVARFKGGDNFVFGRGYEEVLACQEAGVPVTVIPGISSPFAVPAVAGIPVTHRGVTHDLDGRLRPPAPGPPRLARPVGRTGQAARHAGADDGGGQRPDDRGGAAARRPRGGDPGGRRLRRARCPPSAPC